MPAKTPPPSSKSLPSLVVIGGGTGSFTLLRDLKAWTPNLTALVSMADDGGSTGVLRDELGVLPPGDVRQCLVALSEAPEELRELFNFRFPGGSLAGHSFGNLFLSAVEKMTDNFADAVRMASDILRITGRVLPITLDNVRLVLEGADGAKVRGEHQIDMLSFTKEQRRPRLSIEPAASLNPAAREAILQADMVVIAPGDLYTSLGSALITSGVREALQQTAAQVVYVCNLVVKPGHTAGFSVADHAAEIERFVGVPVLDAVLYNRTSPPPELMERYTKEGELPVEAVQAELSWAHYQAIGGPFLAHVGSTRNVHDHFAVPRSLIRHDGQAVTRALKQFLAAHSR